jgi:hypothetical protein
VRVYRRGGALGGPITDREKKLFCFFSLSGSWGTEPPLPNPLDPDWGQSIISPWIPYCIVHKVKKFNKRIKEKNFDQCYAWQVCAALLFTVNV